MLWTRLININACFRLIYWLETEDATRATVNPKKIIQVK